MKMLGPCVTFPPDRRATCAACGRSIRCVYVVDDWDWTFTLGRRCYAKLQAFLTTTPDSTGAREP